MDLQIQLDFSHRVGSGREAWARHITNWRTVTTPLGLVASYCSSYHHISICLLDAFCIMDPYFGHQLLYVHMTAMYILLRGLLLRFNASLLDCIWSLRIAFPDIAMNNVGFHLMEYPDWNPQ